MHRKQDELGRFSDPSLLILASLASGPRHGYAMMEDISQFSGTRRATWRPRPVPAVSHQR